MANTSENKSSLAVYTDHTSNIHYNATAKNCGTWENEVFHECGKHQMLGRHRLTGARIDCNSPMCYCIPKILRLESPWGPPSWKYRHVPKNVQNTAFHEHVNPFPLATRLGNNIPCLDPAWKTHLKSSICCNLAKTVPKVHPFLAPTFC